MISISILFPFFFLARWAASGVEAHTESGFPRLMRPGTAALPCQSGQRGSSEFESESDFRPPRGALPLWLASHCSCSCSCSAVAVQCIGSGLTALSTCRLWHPLVSLPPRGHAQPRRLALPRSLGSAALSAPPGSPIQPALVVAVSTLCLLPSSPTSSSRIVTTHRVPATLATCLSQANELFVSTQERPSIDPH